MIILGAVQGICEFLPISSSGHLVLLSTLFGIKDSLFVSIILHLATLIAVIFVFWKDVKYLLLHPLSSQAIKIYLATISTCIIVLAFMPFIGDSFSGKYLAFCFFISSVILFIVDYLSQKIKSKSFTNKNALIMGVAQGLAILPGISRSGATISAGLLSGADKNESAKFSFLMSIPIILLSTFEEIFSLIIKKEPLSVNGIGIVLAFIIAFIIGILSIKVMLKITQKSQFKWFSIYLLILAIICIIVLK